jgi:DNA-binding response OmpR family regulator
MLQRGRIFILVCDGAARDLAVSLRRLRWATFAFDSLAALFDGLQGQVPDVLVLHGTCPDVAERIASLRRVAPAAALVWHARGATPGGRIAALDAAVEPCIEAGMDPLEWDALLRGLCRRGRRGSSPWRVDSLAGALTGPAGECLPLTAAECAFFVQLLNAPGHRLRREELLPADARGTLEGTRRVDVLVSRLRGKARRLNIEFPVLAVRGWGYMLLPEPDGRRHGPPRATARPGCPGA